MKQIIVILLAVIAGWAGFQYATAVYECVQIKQQVVVLIGQHKNDKYDSELINDIADYVRSKPGTKIKEKDIDVDRSSERVDALVKLSYTKTVEVPIFKKKWVIRFSPEIKATVGF